MAQSMYTLDLNGLPPILVGKLLYILVSDYLDYFDVKDNIVRITHEDYIRFINDIYRYVNSDEFNNVITKSTPKYYSPIDGFIMNKVCGGGKVQDIVKRYIDSLRNNPVNVFKEIMYKHKKTSTLIGSKPDIPSNLAPPLIVADFAEGIRYWPANQLNVVGQGKRERVITGIKRGVELSCMAYVLIVIAYSLSFVTKHGLNEYLLLIPLVLNKELSVNLKNRRSRVRELLQKYKVDPGDLTDVLYGLFMAGAIRSRAGAVETVGLTVQRGKRVTIDFEVVVEFDGYGALIDALNHLDRKDKFPELVLAVSRDLNSKNNDVQRVAGYFMDVLRRLHMIAQDIGDVERARYEAHRILYEKDLVNKVAKITKANNAYRIYEWALNKLSSIIDQVYENVRETV